MDSFYLERVKNCMKNNAYDKIGSHQFTRWYNTRSLLNIKKLTLKDITFHEETYMGHQLIVIGWHHEIQNLYDQNDQPFTTTMLNESQISRYGEVEKVSRYSAYAWEIGTDYDRVADINWLNQFTVLSGVCGSNKEATTIKSAKKKLDLFAKILAVKSDVIATASDRIYYESKVNPYNATIGDQPFIQAFGRLRKGKIVETVGSRFIVAYCTPSNPNELKYKTLPLSHLWIESGV